MKTKLKQIVGAVGLALAMGPAMAGITWKPAPQSTLFEDDNLDFALQVNTKDPNYDASKPGTWTLIPSTSAGLNVGDVLVAVVEFNVAGGQAIGPGQELTGVSVIEVKTIDFTTGKVEFQPYQGGLNAATGVSVPDGGVGGGAMVALWLDNTPDLDVGASSLPNFSCTSLAQCITQASDGALWQVDGFGPDASNNYWTSSGGDKTFAEILVSDPATRSGQFNAGLDILTNATGQNLALLSYNGTKGPVDVLISGNINGGGCVDQDGDSSNGIQCQTGLVGLVEDGYAATSDVDLSKRLKAPEPGTMMLLGAGLLGLGLRRRRA